MTGFFELLLKCIIINNSALCRWRCYCFGCWQCCHTSSPCLQFCHLRVLLRNSFPQYVIVLSLLEIVANYAIKVRCFLYLLHLLFVQLQHRELCKSAVNSIGCYCSKNGRQFPLGQSFDSAIGGCLSFSLPFQQSGSSQGLSTPCPRLSFLACFPFNFFKWIEWMHWNSLIIYHSGVAWVRTLVESGSWSPVGTGI